MTRVIDLHTHTFFSDGQLSPKQLIKRAEKVSLSEGSTKELGDLRRKPSLLSITDHDSIKAYDSLKKSGYVSNIIKLVPGIELSTFDKFVGGVHILGYDIDYSQKDIKRILQQQDEIKRIKYEYYVEVLKECGLDDALAFLQYRFENEMGTDRHVVLDYLRLMGAEEEDVRALSLELKNVASEGVFRPDTAETIRAIKSAGGVSSLAHPSLIKTERPILKRSLKYWAGSGLSGVECFHPAHSFREIKEIGDIAGANNLAISAGSDFHRVPNAERGINVKDIGQVMKDGRSVSKVSIENILSK